MTGDGVQVPWASVRQWSCGRERRLGLVADPGHFGAVRLKDSGRARS